MIQGKFYFVTRLNEKSVLKLLPFDFSEDSLSRNNKIYFLQVIQHYGQVLFQLPKIIYSFDRLIGPSIKNYSHLNI